MRSVFQNKHLVTVLRVFKFTILSGCHHGTHSLHDIPVCIESHTTKAVSTICRQYAQLSTLFNDLCGHQCFFHKKFYQTSEIKILMSEKLLSSKM